MKNYVQDGDTLVIPAPSGGCTSGKPFLQGKILAVPKVTAAEGIPAACQVTGVVRTDRATGTAWAIGDTLYWDAANARLTKTATSNTFVGHAAEAAASGDAEGAVRLQFGA